jgi:hypothetical protein
MFDFRKITISDKDRAEASLKVSDFRGCEYCFANNLAWNRLADTLVAFENDFYISCSFYGGEPYFTFPSGVKTDERGKERYLELFSRLRKYAQNQGAAFRVSSVTPENLVWLKGEFKDKITVTAERDSFDYIYNSCDLITLAGKKYHGKRNHIKRFKENDWELKMLTPEHFDECTAFAARFYNSAAESDFSAAVEQYAIYTYFENFDALGLCGAVLYSEGRLVGFTVGERLNSDTFDVHIEKADAAVQGAYPTLCSEFAKAAAADFKYINREEDLGLEGLRKSKMSYRPAFLQKKYTVEFL